MTGEIAKSITDLNLNQIKQLGADLRTRLGDTGFKLLIEQMQNGRSDMQTLYVDTKKMVNKINVIKAIRAATDMGLRDAKETSESWEGFTIAMPIEKVWNFKEAVTEAGCIVKTI